MKFFFKPYCGHHSYSIMTVKPDEISALAHFKIKILSMKRT